MLTLEIYNANSFVIRGNSYQYKENLKAKGGMYNSKLTGGPGWIFRIAFQKELQEFVDSVNGGTVEPISFNQEVKVPPLTPANNDVMKELKSLRRDYDKLMEMYRMLDQRFNLLSVDGVVVPNKESEIFVEDEDELPAKPVGKKKRFL